MLLLVFNNGIKIQFGYTINTSTVTLPISYTAYYNVTLGIVYAKQQYGYDAIKSKTLSSFTYYTYISNLGQMWIACGY